MGQQEEILRSVGVDTSTANPLGGSIPCYTIPGGEEAVRIWHALRERVADLQAWPLLCGGEEEREYIDESLNGLDGTDTDFYAIPPEGLSLLDIMDEQRRREREAMLEFMKQFPDGPNLTRDDEVDSAGPAE